MISNIEQGHHLSLMFLRQAGLDLPLPQLCICLINKTILMQAIVKTFVI
jgi:hypothetical protein